MAVQPKLTVGPPGDRYEQEAERIADEVMRRERAPTEDDHPLGSELTPLIQRPSADVEEVGEVADEEGAEELQAQRSATGLPPSVPGWFETKLRQIGSGGEPLPRDVMTSMEHAFGVSFAAVRTHADADAAALSRTIGASAFTHGAHIYLAPNRFDPAAGSGRRLLAHELTHVVQQNPALASGQARGAAAPGVQRQATIPGESAPAKPRRFAFLFLYDAKNERLGEPLVVTITEFVALEPGSYPATVTSDTVTAGGIEIPYELTMPKDRADEARARIVIARSAYVVVAEPSGKKPKPAEKTVEPVAPDPASKPASHKAKGDSGASGGTGTEPDEDAGGQGESGSRYGFLGLIHPPKWLAKALDFTIEKLGLDKEIKEIQALLRAIKSLWEHRDELGSLFTTDKLFGVLLGIEGGEGIDDLGLWAMSKSRAPAAGGASSTGIAAIAARLAKIVDVIHRILRPVFGIRKRFRDVIDGFARILEKVPLLEEVPSAGPDRRHEILGEVADEIAEQVRTSLLRVRERMDLVTGQLETTDYVSATDISRAIADVAQKFEPKPARILSWAVSLVGVDIEQKIADHIIAPIIPQDALDAINDVVRGVLGRLEPVIKDVTGLIDDLLAGIEAELHDLLEPELEALFAQLSTLDGAKRRGLTRVGHVTPAMAASSGQTLPADVSTELGAELGFDLGDVRVHADAHAARAAETLEAKAFTVGGDIFFGADRYAPGTRDGRRLLAHELVHVAQQAGGVLAGAIQRDAKDAAKKKLDGTIVGSIIGRFRPTAAVKKLGAEITKRVQKLIGREVVSDKRPKPELPEAYYYVTNKHGDPVNIRRTSKFITVVPKLTISRAGPKKIPRIALSTSVVSPETLWKNRQRRALRRALGCKSDEQAHHVIPLELLGPFGGGGHSVVVAAVKAGFQFNGRENGVCLAEEIHEGPHANYTRRVRQSLDGIRALHLGPAEELARVREMAKGYKGRLAGREDKLD